MAPRPPFRKSFAVVIGIDHYSNGIPELNTAVNDARRLGEMLSTLHGYEVTSLLDAEATGARITTLLTEELPKTVGHNDRLLFYFAGHGVAASADEGPNGYLLPADARRAEDETFLQMPKVHDALLALNCRHMLVVLDSCFSGAFRWSGAMRDLEPMSSVVHQEKYDRFVRDPAWQVITSASQDQKAIDQLMTGALGGRGEVGAHSPFAQALFDAISGAGDVVPRDGGDGLVTATELYLYLEQALTATVAAVGKRQTPRLWPLKKHDKGEFVFFVPGKELSLPPAPPLTFDRNPWVGLSSYDASSSSLFFGRDAEIAGLRETIATKPLTVVVGASGTGKSSLVKAGVVPRLQTEGWHVLPNMRPGTNALASLAKAVSAAAGPAVSASPAAIAARIAALVGEQGTTPVLLVIDQFEELITLAESANERHAALDLLAQLVTTHAATFRLVVTIRTDFEPNFDRTAFGERWLAGRYVIPPMSRESLRAVIEKPAEARVLYFEPSSLVDKLLDEVVATPGALPLLSFALSEMYIEFVKRQGSDRAITAADVGAVGGVAGALRSRADREYAALSPDEQATLRRVMLRMVAVESSGLARRRITDAELDFANPGERARARAVVKRFTDARLLVEGREADSESFVEPAHDALVRGWGELQTWIRKEQGAPFSLQQQRLLTRSTAEWDRAPVSEREGLLWRDAARSAQLRPLVRAQAVWLTERELAFARRSIRGRNVARATAAAAVLLIAISGVAATIAGLRASRQAEQVRIASIVRTAQSLVEENPLLAALLLGSLDSATVSQLDAADQLAVLGTASLLQSGPQVMHTLSGGVPIDDARMSPDGRWLVRSDATGEVWLRELGEVSTAPFLFPDSVAATTATAFDRTSRRLAIATLTGHVRVYAPDAPERPLFTLRSSAVVVEGLCFSPDGRRLYMRDAEGHVETVDVAVEGTQPGPVVRLPLDSVTDVRIGASGELLTLHAWRTFRVWSPRGQRIHELRLPGNERMYTVETSADGRQVALGGEAGSLRLVTLGGAPRSVSLPRHAAGIAALAWSPDGRQLVSTSTDGAVKLWHLPSRTLARQFMRPDEPMQTAAFRRDGRSFVVSSPYSMHALVVDTNGTIQTLRGHANEILVAEYERDSDRIITVSRDGWVWRWSPVAAPLHRTRGGIEPAHPSGGDVVAIGFRQDSRGVALGTRDGLVYRYPVGVAGRGDIVDSGPGTPRVLRWSSDGQEIRALVFDGSRLRIRLHPTPTRESHGSGREEFLTHTTVARDQEHTLAMSSAGEASVWRLGTLDRPFRRVIVPADSVCRDPEDPEFNPDEMSLCTPVEPACTAMSTDARWLAVCGPAGAVDVQRIDSVTRPRTPVPVPAFVASVALNRNATLLATGRSDGSVTLTELRHGREAVSVESSRTITHSDQGVKQLLFAEDAARLAALYSDGWIRVIDVASGKPLLSVRPRGRDIQTMRFTPDGRFLVTVAVGEKDIQLWNVLGSGNALTFTVDGGLIAAVDVSPDSRWLLGANDRQVARLFPLDVNVALTEFRTRPVCLSPVRRRQYLLESPEVAEQRFAACVDALDTARPSRPRS